MLRTKLTKEKTKKRITNYSFNKTLEPFPEVLIEKGKPPVSDLPFIDNSELFKPKAELTLDEQAQAYMDAYRKAERFLINNFYTGGGPYKKGILDSIYKGVNPLNP